MNSVDSCVYLIEFHLVANSVECVECGKCEWKVGKNDVKGVALQNSTITLINKPTLYTALATNHKRFQSKLYIENKQFKSDVILAFS